MSLIEKAGTPKKHHRFRITCRDCGCVFVAERHEFTFADDPRPGESAWTIRCPQDGCDRYTFVSDLDAYKIPS